MRIITLRALAFAASLLTVPAAAAIAGSAFIYSVQPSVLLGSSDDATRQFAQLPGDFPSLLPRVPPPPPLGLEHHGDMMFRPGGEFMPQPRMVCKDVSIGKPPCKVT